MVYFPAHTPVPSYTAGWLKSQLAQGACMESTQEASTSLSVTTTLWPNSLPCAEAYLAQLSWGSDSPRDLVCHIFTKCTCFGDFALDPTGRYRMLLRPPLLKRLFICLDPSGYKNCLHTCLQLKCVQFHTTKVNAWKFIGFWFSARTLPAEFMMLIWPLVVVPRCSVSFQVLHARLHWIDKIFEDITRLKGRRRLGVFTPET